MFEELAAPEFLQLLKSLQGLKVVGGERKLFQEGADLGSAQVNTVTCDLLE